MVITSPSIKVNIWCMMGQGKLDLFEKSPNLKVAWNMILGYRGSTERSDEGQCIHTDTSQQAKRVS